MQKIRFSIIILLFLLAILNACSKKENERSEQKFTGKNFVEVISAEKKKIMSFLELSGIVKAELSAFIAPEVSNKVMKYFVKEGDSIKKGDLLAEMDSTQFFQAKSQFENTKKKYERMKKLRETGAIDEQTFDEIETGYKIAKASYEFMLANTKITAPFDGIISSLTKNEGESFSPMMPSGSGDPSILRIVNLDKIKTRINVCDKDVNKIKVGQKTIINVDSEPGKNFIGKITFVSPEADIMSGTFVCEISYNNSDHLLKPNQLARIKIILAETNNSIVLPQNALINSQYVFVVSNGIAIRKEVVLGIQNESDVEILSGISKGDLVVVSGNVGLKDNSLVEIKN